MASNKKAAKAGAGAVAAGKAVRSNEYVQRIVEDDELRQNLRTAYQSARKAYTRMANGKGPVRSVTRSLVRMTQRTGPRNVNSPAARTTTRMRTVLTVADRR